MDATSLYNDTSKVALHYWRGLLTFPKERGGGTRVPSGFIFVATNLPPSLLSATRPPFEVEELVVDNARFLGVRI